jgi:hypothetical protein
LPEISFPYLIERRSQQTPSGGILSGDNLRDTVTMTRPDSPCYLLFTGERV